MDGLVSTGNKFPVTILVRKLANKKIFLKYFIHIPAFIVDNEQYDRSLNIYLKTNIYRHGL